MNINFSPVDENFIKTMVKDGYYSNATELVRDAVRRMREEKQRKLDRLHELLDESEKDIAAGNYEVYTPELLDKIVEQAIKNAKAGKKTDPEVTGEI